MDITYSLASGRGVRAMRASGYRKAKRQAVLSQKRTAIVPRMPRKFRLYHAPEVKYMPVFSTNGSNLATSGTTQWISACTTGDDFTNREGRKVRLRAFEMRYTINNTQTGAMPSVPCRMVAFIDKETNGVSPTWSDVFESTGVNPLASAPRNGSNIQRFKIIYDSGLVNVNNQGTEFSDNVYVDLEGKYPNMITTYDGTTDVITDALQNHIWIAWCSAAAITASNSTSARVGLTCTARVSFRDM